MKQYFMKLDLNQPKNKAQQAAQDFAEPYADCLIDELKLEEFKQAFNDRIAEINKEHPRCTDLQPVWIGKEWHDQSILLGVDAGITFNVRLVKRYDLAEVFIPDGMQVD